MSQSPIALVQEVVASCSFMGQSSKIRRNQTIGPHSNGTFRNPQGIVRSSAFRRAAFIPRCESRGTTRFCELFYRPRLKAELRTGALEIGRFRVYHSAWTHFRSAVASILIRAESRFMPK